MSSRVKCWRTAVAARRLPRGQRRRVERAACSTVPFDLGESIRVPAAVKYEVRDTTVGGVCLTSHEAPLLEALDDASDGARVQVHCAREVAGRHAGPHADQAEREALGPADTEGVLHALGCALECVLHLPHYLEERRTSSSRPTDGVGLLVTRGATFLLLATGVLLVQPLQVGGERARFTPRKHCQARHARVWLQ